MRLFLSLALMLVTTATFSQNQVFHVFTDSVELRKANDELIKDFENRVHNISGTFTMNGTRTIVGDSLYAGFYYSVDNRIHLPNWSTTPKAVLDFCTEVAGGKKEGEKLAASYFYGFFLPHEIAHALQFNAGIRFDNQYDNEYEANKIAILYWRMRGKDVELKECYRIAKRVLSVLQNPFPSGVDEKKYFNDHYDEFSQNPYQYGYVMFKQIVMLFEGKDKIDFETYIKSRLIKK